MKPEVAAMVERASGAVRDWAVRAGAVLPEVGFVFGSGLARASEKPPGCLENTRSLPYSAIPGLAACTAPGHRSRLVFGTIHPEGAPPLPAAALLGRHHLYEGRSPDEAAFGVRLLAALGIRRLLLTAAVGAMRPDLRVGDFMAIEDHLNLTGTSPLRGEEPGPEARFPDMTHAWDRGLRAAFRRAADRLGMRVPAGVYAGVLGPQFETPAEIRMLSRIGGDVVGMSVVTEAIAARHAGLRIAGLAFCSNLAAGCGDAPLDADHVNEVAGKAAPRLARLITAAAAEPELQGSA